VLSGLLSASESACHSGLKPEASVDRSVEK
jgi:hypothetical protein